ncbi:MAG: hypothetical protein LW878_13550 [Proteobacteria bacterium]|nr:hypothetical protein [Pseudomonadota bacterium]
MQPSACLITSFNMANVPQAMSEAEYVVQQQAMLDDLAEKRVVKNTLSSKEKAKLRSLLTHKVHDV